MRIGTRLRQRHTQGRITLNLASMIDVTFLLLIYFMVTMVLVDQEDMLQPTLQTESDSGAGTAQDLEPQIVEVYRTDAGPRYQLGSRVLADRDALLAVLEALPKSGGVIVSVRDHVTVAFAMAAFQAAHDAGFEKVTYVPAS